AVVVEGTSDQNYMTAIKNVLIARKKISPRRELLFVAAGGAKGVNTIAPILASKDEPPMVLLDDDRQGRQFAEQLRSGPVYAGAAERIVSVKDVAKVDGGEIEDLLQSYVIDAASRMLRNSSDQDFEDVAERGQPIVPQVEAYAAKCGVPLPKGWKVDLARLVKQRLLKDVDNIPDDVLKSWSDLFARFDPTRGRAKAIAKAFAEVVTPPAPRATE
ncbi:MAG TPA: hypothetical protein VL463_24640, partial [Kofleriaceae bacterium]|nr:hypothetical protein [Kofleriaceae bacterium]